MVFQQCAKQINSRFYTNDSAQLYLFTFTTVFHNKFIICFISSYSLGRDVSL